MEGAYTLLVGMLFALAVVDLMVGVSNDAVNFLNSAIGSKVASIRTILIVASVGIFLGAVFSSGMMEVARKGIFVPSLFTMQEIMIIFLAVMITDILLLDFFNTLALPTSTTVSIVFELLGAALLLAIVKSSASPDHEILDYINTTKAAQIIAGIFLSVGIAFTVGALVQYLARLWFTFDFERYIPRFGWVFGGLAIAAISYFVLIKGLKGSQLLSEEQVHWIKSNTLLLSACLFAASAVILLFLHRFFRIHPLRMVVLAGTFALAMAFAGNDLVNFIGVPITGFQTYQVWMAQGLAADTFTLDFLEEAVRTPTYLLVIAGGIMVLTLWFSGKARKVTETEVNLGRQGDGDERFNANELSRTMVGLSLFLGKLINRILPNSLLNQLSSRFDKFALRESEKDQAAFDLVRASANLMVASILIAIASSMKLPLSTTYVSFMVAMGTSLADRAWGRESAVYRVAGVLNVIGGWFMTAITALVVSGLAAYLFYSFGLPAIIILFVLAAFLIIRSHLRFVRKKKQDESEQQLDAQREMDRQKVIELTREQTIETLHSTRRALRVGIRELPRENTALVKKVHQLLSESGKKSRKRQAAGIRLLRSINEEPLEIGRFYLQMHDLHQDMGQSGVEMMEACSIYLQNKHEPPEDALMHLLLQSEQALSELLMKIETAIRSSDWAVQEVLSKEKKTFIHDTEGRLKETIQLLRSNKVSNKSVQLAIRVLMESKDIAAIAMRIMRAHAH